MQLLSTFTLCALLVAGIRCENEPSISSSLYKDSHRDYVQQFHHGQPHGSEVVSNSVSHLVPNSQIQDQPSIQDQVGHSSSGHVGHVGHGGQVGHVGQVGQVQSAVTPVGPVGPVGPQGPISPVAPVPSHINIFGPIPYFGQKSESVLHAGARAIAGTPTPSAVQYYPYFGRTYASPVYSQYQPVPHQGVYQQQAYPYSVNPYSAVPYSAVPVPTPVYSGYSGYNYPYYSQYVPGVPPYYNQQSGEVQSVSKQ